MSDSVRHPKHYELEGLNGIESIDIIRSVLGKMGFEQFCRGNELKYLIRANKKNGLEDLRKAQVYLGWEIDTRGKRESEMSELPEETRTTIDSHTEKPSEVKNEPSEPTTCDKMEEGISLTKSENHSKAEELAGDYFVRHGKAPVKKGKGRPAKFDWSKASNLYAQGYDLPDIAKIIGCEESTIWNRKSRHPEEFVRRSE